jgi:hypothetical protein
MLPTTLKFRIEEIRIELKPLRKQSVKPASKPYVVDTSDWEEVLYYLACARVTSLARREKWSYGI